MFSFKKTVLIAVLGLVYIECNECVLPSSDVLTLNKILAEEKNLDETESIKANLIYGDDWSFLSGVTGQNAAFTQINNNYLPLPNPQNTKGFRCSSEHDRVKLDMDGDGEFDTDIKNKDSFVTYKIEYPNGNKLNYRVRVFTKGVSSSGRPYWFFQRACYLTAKTPLETFIIIDDNTNGYFDNYGKDAIIVGSNSKQAIPLSSVIAIKNKFYSLNIEMTSEPPPDGKKITNYTGMTLKLEPYAGDTGKMDLIKNLKPPKDPPQAIIIKGGDNSYFQVTDKEVLVPTGDYYLVSAVFGRRCRARSNSKKPLATVEKDKTVAPFWGAPFTLNVNPYCEKGGEVTLVSPIKATRTASPHYSRQFMDCPFIKIDYPTVTGSLGEEYYAPDEFKDIRGFAFPDGGVCSFNVEIKPKDTAPNTKPINKISANPFAQDWIPIDLSGWVIKSPPFLDDYRCPIEKYRGAVIVKVWCSSRVFGGILASEKEVEVKE